LKAILAAPSLPPPAGPPTDAPSQQMGRTHNCNGYYPYLSDRLAESGTVLVRFDVSETGAITAVRLGHTSGNDRLDRAAVSCVSRHWRNTPAYRGGMPVASPDHRAFIDFRPYKSAPTDTDRAETLASMARYDEAVAEYSRILTVSPDDADLYFHRGLANYVAGHYADAERDFDKAASLKPDFDEAVAGRELAGRSAIAATPTEKKGI
jgi:protein TonB